MRRSELLRSTAFRLALAFICLILFGFVIAGTLAYRIILTDLNERLDRTLADSYEMISRSYSGTDLEDLTGTVGTYAASTNDHNRIYYLADATGNVLSGNVARADVRPGVSTVGASSFGLAGDTRFRARSDIVAGNKLVIATSFEETDELSRLILSSFFWAGALATVAAVGAALLLAAGVRKRMDMVTGTMNSVGQGDLTARIPLSGGNDDIDIMSGQINSALDRLAALVEGMRQVSVDIAHDLKTPLHRLSIIIETALEEAEQGRNTTAELEQAQMEAGKVNATFEALLRIAQLESGARRERFADVDVNTMLALLIEAYEDVALDNQQALNFHRVPGQEFTVRGDKDLLVQLFANLIENAIRHAIGGTTIEVSVAVSAGAVSVSIADDGPGIPEAEREKVFRRLYRLEKSRTTEGTGLGLSMVKAIADLHGAQIELTDAHPGLAVNVTFPPGTRDAAGVNKRIHGTMANLSD